MHRLPKLGHGGIMANYRCTAACRHCLYACSPQRAGGYITEEGAHRVCTMLRHGGCSSVHIGGGEPFLDIEGLLALIRAAQKADITIEYIETNAGWAVSEDHALEYLRMLRRAGNHTLCISVDPFHMEYIAADRPLLLAKMCEAVDVNYFFWQNQYLPLVTRLDTSRPHSRSEIGAALGEDYILETTRSYGLRCGGRAINIEWEYLPRKPLEDVIEKTPCRCLRSTDHFHVDMKGNYIPPICTGLILPLEELLQGVEEGRFPVLDALSTGGGERLLAYARGLGFEPDGRGYSSKCSLCFDMRHWLSRHGDCPELDANYYAEAVNHYD